MSTNKIERLTAQKKFVIECLKSTNTHPSAQEIYLRVKKKIPTISKGTVYRILKHLKNQGIILEVPGKISRFDGDLSPHAHFVCEKCQKIFDIFEKMEGTRILKSKKLKVGKIRRLQIYFYGTCTKCCK